MPANRNALLRYRTIDRCLRNRARRWTLDDLIGAVSDALYEYEGRQVDVSRRTVQLDLQHMRSDRLGYRAPIEVYERKFYRYADPDYRLTESELNEQDLARLREAAELLRQFSGFRQMEAFGGLVGRLRDQLGAGRTDGRRVIDFEHNEHLRGLHFVDELYELCVRERRVWVMYQSFRAREPRRIDFEPYFLKESRNRYFVLGRERAEERVLILALDRIHGLESRSEVFARRPGLDIETYFRHTVGVSVSAPPQRVVLRIDREQAPYLLTKPIHASQRALAQAPTYVEVELDVQHTFELEKEILAFGSAIQVVEPERLRIALAGTFAEAVAAYARPTSEAEWAGLRERFHKRGYLEFPSLFSGQQLRRLHPDLRVLLRDFPVGATRDIFPRLSPKRQRILRDGVGGLLESLFAETEASVERLFARSTALSPDTPYRPATTRRLLVARSKWSGRAGGPEVIRGSHLARDAEAAERVFARADFGNATVGGYGYALLLERGTWWRMRGERTREVIWLEVDLG